MFYEPRSSDEVTRKSELFGAITVLFFFQETVAVVALFCERSVIFREALFTVVKSQTGGHDGNAFNLIVLPNEFGK